VSSLREHRGRPDPRLSPVAPVGTEGPNAPIDEPQPDRPIVPATPQEPEPEVVQQPGKLLRIATMTRELLEEVRQASLDEPGRKRLQQIYESSLTELKDVLTPQLREELSELASPFEGTPSAAEIRLAQAQLLGWLEGLFHGIQAALFAQQMLARTTLEELRRRGLPSGMPGQRPGGRQPEPGGTPGQYL